VIPGAGEPATGDVPADHATERPADDPAAGAPAAEHGAADPTGDTIRIPADPATPQVPATAPLHRSANPMFQAAGHGQPVAPPVYPPQPGPPAAPVPIADLPAGIDPDELTAVPGTTARRGKLRRRIAFLRAARELLLRDLGGFVYELHRTAGDVEHTAHRQLRDIKLGRLSQVDAELHALELRLDDVRRQVLVREPGVGGECPDCGELFGSAAHYCSHCGLPLTESARRAAARAREPVAAADPVIVPAAAKPPKDQPTEEISPLDPDHPSAGADFQWPRRENADTSWAAAPATAGEATTGELPTGEAQAGATAPADAPTAEEQVGDAGPRDTAAGEAATAGEKAAAGEAPQDAPSGETAAADDAPAGDGAPQDAAGESAPDDAPASDGAPQDAAGESAPDDAPAGDGAPQDAAGEAAPDDAPAGEAGAGDPPRGETVQDNGSILSPVERRP
jgi:hypothetical protein